LKRVDSWNELSVDEGVAKCRFGKVRYQIRRIKNKRGVNEKSGVA